MVRNNSILMLELNEVPWKVADFYGKTGRCPNLARFLSESRTYTSLAVDDGELSPWVTWPSLHRGMNNRQHGVKNLGQDPKTFMGVPIWEEFQRAGLSIGVCGSMQSWPPSDPGKNGFFIPDTFAHDGRCIPEYVEPFQRFNLDQVRRNGRVVAKGGGFGSNLLPMLRSLPRLGIRMRSLLEIAGQLAAERREPARRSRRPIFQSLLLWDIFRKLYNPSDPPAFSSFFTNHVAGVMHRYWHHLFPEDFQGRYSTEDPIHKATMDFAMEVTDRMLGDAMKMADANPGIILVLATSMGQAAVFRDEHEGVEASIPDIPSLMRVCGVPEGEFRPLLAMVPQIAVEIPNEAVRKRTESLLKGAATATGKQLFRVEETGMSLSITILTPSLEDIAAGGFTLVRSGSEKESGVNWKVAGIRMNEVEPGTAYHIPEGILAIRGDGIAPSDTRTPLPADEIKGLLLDLAGFPGKRSVAEKSAAKAE